MAGLLIIVMIVVRLAGCDDRLVALRPAIRTVIIIDPVWVTVGRRRMRRDQFGGFLIHHSLARAGRSRAVLGYHIATAALLLAASGPETRAEAVASALDGLLIELPMTADVLRSPPEALRAARPTAF